MRKAVSIFFVWLALLAVCTLEMIPHHHHGYEVCFGNDNIEAFCNHSNHGESAPDECPLEVMFREYLTASNNIHIDITMSAIMLPTDLICIPDVTETAAQAFCYNPYSATPYDSPTVSHSALRAPPIA